MNSNKRYLIAEAPVRPTHINLESVTSRSLSVNWGPDRAAELKYIVQYRPAAANGQCATVLSQWIRCAPTNGNKPGPPIVASSGRQLLYVRLKFALASIPPVS